MLSYNLIRFFIAACRDPLPNYDNDREVHCKLGCVPHSDDALTIATITYFVSSNTAQTPTQTITSQNYYVSHTSMCLRMKLVNRLWCIFMSVLACLSFTTSWNFRSQALQLPWQFLALLPNLSLILHLHPTSYGTDATKKIELWSGITKGHLNNTSNTPKQDPRQHVDPDLNLNWKGDSPPLLTELIEHICMYACMRIWVLALMHVCMYAWSPNSASWGWSYEESWK